MQLSKWFISKQAKLIHKGKLRSPLRILVLDDHKLFRSAVTVHCILPYFKDCELLEFENGDTALAFITNEIHHNRKIDLIITDINHPGLRGNELVKSIRLYEKSADTQTRIPIIMLTMVEERNYPELLADNIVDHYFTKATEPEDIVECMEEILYVE